MSELDDLRQENRLLRAVLQGFANPELWHPADWGHAWVGAPRDARPWLVPSIVLHPEQTFEIRAINQHECEIWFNGEYVERTYTKPTLDRAVAELQHLIDDLKTVVASGGERMAE